MKYYKINPDSYHYRLASFYADYNDRWHTDVCTYWRKVIRGFFNILLGLLALFICAGSIIHFALGVVFSVFTDMSFVVTWQMIPVVLTIIGVVGIAAIYAVGHIVEWAAEMLSKSVRDTVRNAAAKEQPPLFITAYRSIKEKTCIPVKVVHKSK